MCGTQVSKKVFRKIRRLMCWAAFVFQLLVHFDREREVTPVSKRTRTLSDFVAFIPHQIEADWDGKYGPLLAGFPLNILFASSPKLKSGKAAGIISSLYQPYLASFAETNGSRELTYLNKHGGPYTLRVVLNQTDGSRQVFKYKEEKLLGCAEGKDFRLTMIQVALLGIEDDEPVTFGEGLA
jgi:hypothetical protein